VEGFSLVSYIKTEHEAQKVMSPTRAPAEIYDFTPKEIAMTLAARAQGRAQVTNSPTLLYKAITIPDELATCIFGQGAGGTYGHPKRLGQCPK
jgi:hypothetical protein